VALYAQLKAQAERDGTTIPAVLQALITDGASMQEWFGELEQQLTELRREVRALREHLIAAPAGTLPTPRDGKFR